MKKTIALMLAFVLSLALFLKVPSFTLAEEYAPLKPVPHHFRKEPLREKLITIAESQVDYYQAYNGSTIFHHLLYPNLKRTDYKYDAPWNTIFLAWVFKTAGIYTPTFLSYSALSKRTLLNRFLTAGNTEGELAYAFFDPSYMNEARPGDLVFLDRFRREKDDYADLKAHKKISQVALIVAKTQGTLTVISPYFQKKVWLGDLNTKHNLHSPYKILGFGVLDAKPTKPQNPKLPTPMLVHEIATGREMVLYYAYEDGTALTSNGERNLSDFLILPQNITTKMSRKIRASLYPTPTSQDSFGQMPDMTELTVLGHDKGRVQILLPWALRDGKSQFPIFSSAWVEEALLFKSEN